MIDEILDTPIAELAGNVYNCSCSRTHMVATGDIIVGSGVISQLVAIVSRVVSLSSRVLIIADNNTNSLFGRMIEKSLVRGQYRPYRKVVPDILLSHFASLAMFEVLEDTRLIIALGGGTIADHAKVLARQLGLPLVIIATSATTSSYLTNSGMLYNRGCIEIYKGSYPSAVIMDSQMLDTSSGVYERAYYEIVSKALAVFDWYVASLCVGEHYCAVIADTITELIDRVCACRKTASTVHLAECNIRLGILSQLIGSSRLYGGGDCQLQHAIILRISKITSKTVFDSSLTFAQSMCAMTVAKFYHSILTSHDTFMLPPDYLRRSEALVGELGIDELAVLDHLLPYQAEETILKYRDIFETNRILFADKVKLIVSKLGINISDVGYDKESWQYFNQLSSGDLALCVALAPEVREKFTLLTLLRDLGYLEKLL